MLTTSQVITILSSGALSGVLVFLLREWISNRLKSSIEHEYNVKFQAYQSAIQHEYDQKLETHKVRLQAESEVAIEKLKSQLHIAAEERSIKLSKVFEQQAETIAAVYAKLIALLRAFETYTHIAGHPNPATRKVLSERMNDFLAYYEPRKLYLPIETQSSIGNFVKAIQDLAFEVFLDVESLSERPDADKKYGETWDKAVSFVQGESTRIMNTLDWELKKILGLAEEEKKA